jgi:hypothetical protein
VAGIRLIRRPGLYGLAIVIAVVAVVSHVLLIVLGGIWLVTSEGFGFGRDLGRGAVVERARRSRSRSRCSPSPASRRSPNLAAGDAHTRARRCRAAS